MNTPLVWGTPEYKRVHKDLLSRRGKAANQTCVDCASSAKDWSYVHDTDPTDVENYVPRCQSCHRKYDYGINGNHLAKLTDDQVREIRAKYRAGATRKELAVEYGIAPSTAANVALGIKYKNVA